MFRTAPIGPTQIRIYSASYSTWSVLTMQHHPQVKICFAEWRRTYTKAFERYALALSRQMVILDIAKHLGVSWDVIKDTQKRYLLKI
jgi:transposase